MLKKLFLTAALIFTTPAMAQQRVPCGEYDKIVKTLQEDYGESLVFQGIMSNGTQLRQTFHNAESGTFSEILIVGANKACITGSGGSGEDIEYKKYAPSIEG
mgnify:CR=1 FL=1